MHLSISRDSKQSLTNQFLNQIKSRILSGELIGGFRLPSTRVLAKQYGVSRNIIIDVYEQLSAEGYIVSATGDGSYIKEGLTYKQEELPKLPELEHGGFLPIDKTLIDFKSGIPLLENFPMNKWLKITKELYQNFSISDLSYGEPAGNGKLREAISKYVNIHRNVKCKPDQIIITGGTTQAIGLLCNILLKGMKHVVLEDPLTKDIYEIVRSHNGHAHPIAMDSEGINIKKLDNKINPCFIYTAPSHSFPLGITMSISRRFDLIEYAKNNNCYIVEDDYDSEFRYDVAPTPSIQGLCPSKVIYIGTFSKTLFPGLRIGYLILPPNLINGTRRAKWLHDLHNSTLEQKVLARFISEGHYERHISRMRKIYNSKRNFLISELRRQFNKSITIIGNEVGMHLAVKFPNIDFNQSTLKMLADKGIKVYTVEEHALHKGIYNDTIIFGYGNLTKKEIKEGIEILAFCLSSLS